MNDIVIATPTESHIPGWAAIYPSVVTQVIQVSPSVEELVTINVSYQAESITWSVPSALLERLAAMIPDDGHRIATFILERDDDGRLIFGDIEGIAFGLGADVEAAFHTWAEYARDLLDGLLSEGDRLTPRLVARCQILDDILS